MRMERKAFSSLLMIFSSVVCGAFGEGEGKGRKDQWWERTTCSIADGPPRSRRSNNGSRAE
jgi:hypothetical protein